MSKTMVPVRMSVELVAKIDAKTENRSALIVAAVEAYLGESPTQIIIERAKPEKKPRASAKPIESESPIKPEKPMERAKQAVYGDWNQAPIYQKPAHAETCRCYSCKPPK
jgi:hypothetical protein